MVRGTEGNRLNLRVPLEGKPDPELAVHVYVFTRDGKFLASAPLEEGKAQLPVEFDKTAATQLFVGPELRKGDHPTLALMQKMHAYKPALRFDPLKTIQELLPIPESIWKLWCIRICHVIGRVVKPVTVAGTVENKPICHARVHICEVDMLRLVLLKLPDLIIHRLRDEILHLVDERFPRPVIRLPQPQPDPVPFRELKITPPAVPALNPVVNLKPARLVPPAVEALEPPAFAVRQPLAAMAPKLQPVLQSPSTQVVRKALLEHLELIQPYLCYFPWFWPYITRYDEIAAVYTDPDGQFEHSFFYWACNDKPDLYFWVEFCVGGAWTTVLKNGVPCHTYWNYASGSEVVLEVNDPLVPYCEQPATVPGKTVVVLSVGDNVNVNQITGGLTKGGAPFGGSLEPHVWFGTGLAAVGVTKYRWSYQALDELKNPIGPWQVPDQQVLRHYAVILPDETVVFKTDLMGPVDQQLFRIQPLDAPEGGVWVPAVNSRLNTASAHFRSDLLPRKAGFYALKLELFTDAGVLVDPSALGIEFRVPLATTNAPFTGTVVTEPAVSFMKEKAFHMTLRIDNNQCVAVIHPVTVGFQTAGSCGFIEYAAGQPVHVSFTASHPNNFATFSFLMTRGSYGTIESASGPVDAPSVNALDHEGDDVLHPYTKVGGVFAANVPIDTLVGGCPGAKGAFSETLGVYATATDGFYTLTYLNAYATPMAFALVPA